MTFLAMCIAVSAAADNGPWLGALPQSAFKVVKSSTGEETWEADIDSPKPVTEIIASWKLDSRNYTGIEVLIKPKADKAGTYSLGKYEVDGSRTSVNNQKDEFARVDTDTLILNNPTRQFHIIVKPKDSPLGTKPKLDNLWLSMTDTKANLITREPYKAAWGKVMEPPRFAQMFYPNGGKICSPTAVSMMLSYWGNKLGKPSVSSDVPQTCQGVFDPGWPGTGNWPFNMAYAALKPGMTAYVSRFRDTRDLELWINKGVPVACSVNMYYLHGEPISKSDPGHLVVLVGFTPEGDPIFNDPGRNVVRMTYKRADFEKAWATSNHTVYLIYPTNFPIPVEPGPWDHQTSAL